MFSPMTFPERYIGIGVTFKEQHIIGTTFLILDSFKANGSQLLNSPASMALSISQSHIFKLLRLRNTALEYSILVPTIGRT